MFAKNTDIYGNVTDTFAYDTYGKLISRTGTSRVIFGYNGRDGVVDLGTAIWDGIVSLWNKWF